MPLKMAGCGAGDPWGVGLRLDPSFFPFQIQKGIMMQCKDCHIEKTPEEFYARSGGICKPCHNARSSAYNSTHQPQHNRVNGAWRKRQKELGIQYLGGKCVKCGASGLHPASYDFHHRDPNEKDFNLGGAGIPFEKMKKELDKCDLNCANCHRAFHAVY